MMIGARFLRNINATNCVIATGGGAVYGTEAVNYLKTLGKLLYLRLPYEEIERRIKNMSSRGIAIGKGLRSFDLYNGRVKLYEKCADIVADCPG